MNRDLRGKIYHEDIGIWKVILHDAPVWPMVITYFRNDFTRLYTIRA